MMSRKSSGGHMILNFLRRLFGFNTSATISANDLSSETSVQTTLNVASQVSPQAGWIEFRDLNNVDERYRHAFVKAQSRLNAILANETPSPVNFEGLIIQGILIDASTSNLDGPGSILGQAGPTHLRSDTGVPAIGIMQFDNNDLDRLLNNGELEDVILHEMFHALGSGPLWGFRGLLNEPAPNDPQYIGPNAVAEYQILLGDTNITSIPVANTGGAGTQNGHWRETTFGTELNTGFLNGISRPLSRMSIAALKDIGYKNPIIDLADPYRLPSIPEIQSLESAQPRRCDICHPEFQGFGE